MNAIKEELARLAAMPDAEIDLSDMPECGDWSRAERGKFAYPDMPERMKSLPRDHRGYPVPWFVAWRDGVPVFPALDPLKLTRAWRNRRCWVCGEPLGRFVTFVIGPMCAINRVSSEPPSHLDCARFAAKYCPFLANPRMKRIPIDKFDGTTEGVPGVMIERNPGVTLVWTSKKPSTFQPKGGGVLFDIGDPHEVEWWAHGRHATRAEVLESITSGLPSLEAQIMREVPHERPAAMADLADRLKKAMRYVPEEDAA